MKVRRAVPENAAELTAIAFAAKRYWGYPEHWIAAWSEALTVTSEYVSTHATFVTFVTPLSIAGFCAINVRRETAQLDHLWVRPEHIGQGLGRLLFRHAEQHAVIAGARQLSMVSDPNARPFYERMGARMSGHKPAPVDGQPRFLPMLVKALT